MIILPLGLCIIFIYVGLLSSKNNVFSPCIITSVIWLLCFVLYLILPHKLPELSYSFYIAISCWIVGICTTSLIIENSKIKCSSYNEAAKLIRDIYLVISILAYPSLIIYATNVIELGDTGNWAKDLRLAALGQSQHFKEVYGGIHVTIWQVTFLLELYFFSKKKWYRLLLVSICCLSFSFVTMSKWNLLNLFFMMVCVLYFKRIVLLKHILLGLGVFLALSIVLQTLRHKSYGGEDFFVLYLVGNMSAFDTLTPASAEHWGESSFRMFYAVFYKMGLSDIEPIDPILPWIKKPLETNTYTGMYPYYKDFGVGGILAFSILLGFIYGWFYRKAKSLSVYSILAYSYFVTIIISQYVGDMFMTNLMGHIKFLCLLYIPFACAKYKHDCLSPNLFHA